MPAQARSLNAVPGRKGIVWIASYPKSGNTWMRMFLGNLTRIMTEGGGFTELQALGRSEASRLDLFERALGKPPAEASLEEIARARPIVHEAIAAESDETVFVKTHAALGAFMGSPTIDLASMAGAIYIVRNPLDIAPSLADHFGETIDRSIERMDTDDCVAHGEKSSVYEFWGSWSQHVASWTGTPQPTIMPVRYEDMITMPTAVFRAIARFTGRDPSNEQLTSAIEMSSFDRLREAERHGGFPEAYREGQQFFRRGRAGGWRDVLTDEQIRRIVRKHHVNMQRVGYMTPDLARYLS